MVGVGLRCEAHLESAIAAGSKPYSRRRRLSDEYTLG